MIIEALGYGILVTTFTLFVGLSFRNVFVDVKYSPYFIIIPVMFGIGTTLIILGGNL